jgi:hypothetical protein
MMVIDNIFDIGDVVYLITDHEQEARIVTHLIVTGGDVQYNLSCGLTLTTHYGIEISKEITLQL